MKIFVFFRTRYEAYPDPNASPGISTEDEIIAPVPTQALPPAHPAGITADAVGAVLGLDTAAIDLNAAIDLDVAVSTADAAIDLEAAIDLDVAVSTADAAIDLDAAINLDDVAPDELRDPIPLENLFSEDSAFVDQFSGPVPEPDSTVPDTVAPDPATVPVTVNQHAPVLAPIFRQFPAERPPPQPPPNLEAAAHAAATADATVATTIENGTPAACIPSWRSRLRHACLLGVDNVDICTLANLTQTISVLRSNGTLTCHLRLTFEDVNNTLSASGLPQLYFEQLRDIRRVTQQLRSDQPKAPNLTHPGLHT